LSRLLRSPIPSYSMATPAPATLHAQAEPREQILCTDETHSPAVNSTLTTSDEPAPAHAVSENHPSTSPDFTHHVARRCPTFGSLGPTRLDRLRR
jgi:hypothetical protein